MALADAQLKDSYVKLDQINLSVTNKSDANVRVYSNAEIFDNGEWISWPYRIEDGVLDAVSTIHPLHAKQTLNLTLDVSEIDPPPIPEGYKPECDPTLQFRFRVVALETVSNEVKSVQFSKPFEIVDPYGICPLDL